MNRIDQFTTQIRDDVIHCIDFGSRIVDKVEGFDGVSKLGVSLLTLYTKYIAPFAKAYLHIDLDIEACRNLDQLLANVVDLNKLTNLAPRFYKWIKEDNSDRNTWKKMFQLTFLCIVTLFDSYSFFRMINGLKKGGDAFKLLKNGSFFLACMFGISNDSDAIDALKTKKDIADQHQRKWSERQTFESNQCLASFYREKITRLESELEHLPVRTESLTAYRQRKISSYREKCNSLEAASNENLYQECNQKVLRKRDVWKARKIHHLNEIDSMSDGRICQGIKITSLALDVTKISLAFFSVSSIAVAGCALPIAATVSTVFDFTNLYLGCRGMSKFHHREYTLDAHVKEVKETLGIDVSKTGRVNAYVYAF